VAVLGLVGAAANAQAGLSDDPNGMADWQGAITVTGPMPDLYEVLAVTIEYCVYGPGQFGLSFPGMDPSDGESYIYAYQLFNNIDPHPAYQTTYDPDYVERFSVGLDSNEAAQGCWFLSGTGIAPSDSDTLFAGSTQVGWDFTEGQMAYSTDPDAVSAVLYFSSPAGPELDKTTVSGWQVASGWFLPSPSLVPEPATMAVMLVGAASLLRRRRRA
jgi:hypothetical protein